MSCRGPGSSLSSCGQAKQLLGAIFCCYLVVSKKKAVHAGVYLDYIHGE